MADCQTCFSGPTAGLAGEGKGKCIDPRGPNKKVLHTNRDEFSLLSEAHCCFGHGPNDTWFVAYHPDAAHAQTGGLTNQEALRLLMPTLGPQWHFGGSAIYQHFRFEHCEIDESNGNSVHSALYK